jgi:aspartyl-tRNA(Asn)/glutamyl-tRNA(Gln) amidotransferase subunit C
MTLQKEDIDYLANLSRIAVKEEEKDALIEKISAILGYVGEISKVDTSNYSHAEAGEHRNIMRNDEVLAENKEIHDAILSNVPEKEGDFVKVKAIF